MLLGAFEAEKAIDEWRRSSDILNVGWDGHDFDVISQKGTIIAAGQIDLFSLYSRIRYGIGIAETHNLTTAAQFMKYLRNRPVPSFRVPTGAKYDDERGFALRSALTLYEPLVAPKPPHLGLLPVVYFRSADIPQRGRGDAAANIPRRRRVAATAATRTFRGHDGRDADVSWTPVRAAGTLSWRSR